MAKVLVIPDSHLKTWVITNGLAIADKLKVDNVVMLGDYFDDFDALDFQYDEMVKLLKDTLRHRPNVIALMGNHELSYCGYPCSGHRVRLKPKLEDAIVDDYRLLYCCAIDGVLYSHAGVMSSWLRSQKVLTENEIRYKLGKKAGAALLENKVNKAGFEKMSVVGPARGGYYIPSPLWADLTELISDPIANVKQVVGHTPVSEIQCIGNCWFTDVYSYNPLSDEYLLVKDGNPEIIHASEVLNDGA